MTILALDSVSLTKYGVKWNFTRSKVGLYSEESPGLLGGKSEPSKCLIIKKLQTRQEKANIVYKSDVQINNCLAAVLGIHLKIAAYGVEDGLADGDAER